jgi:hypothetical protein
MRHHLICAHCQRRGGSSNTDVPVAIGRIFTAVQFFVAEMILWLEGPGSAEQGLKRLNAI